MAEGTVDYYAMVEEAWQLSDAARDYVKNAGRDVDNAELWEKVFAPSQVRACAYGCACACVHMHMRVR